jgi:tetratricopeptide (TPR) repeat protein
MSVIDELVGKMINSFDNGDFNASSSYADLVLNLEQSNDKALYYKASSCFSLKNYDDAVVYYTKLINSVSENKQPLQAFLFRGQAFYNLLNFEKAINDFKKIIDIDPGNLYGQTILAHRFLEGTKSRLNRIYNISISPLDKIQGSWLSENLPLPDYYIFIENSCEHGGYWRYAFIA